MAENSIQKTNRELQKPASKPSGTGERFLEAITSPTIEDCDPSVVAEALRYAMAKIGLRAANMPDQLEKVFLINHLKENFGWLPVAEIRIAFDWALEERLGDYNCYENFSCAYLSKILNAYWRLAKNARVDGVCIRREDHENRLPYNGRMGGLLE